MRKLFSETEPCYVAQASINRSSCLSLLNSVPVRFQKRGKLLVNVSSGISRTLTRVGVLIGRGQMGLSEWILRLQKAYVSHKIQAGDKNVFIEMNFYLKIEQDYKIGMV